MRFLAGKAAVTPINKGFQEEPNGNALSGIIAVVLIFKGFHFLFVLQCEICVQNQTQSACNE